MRVRLTDRFCAAAKSSAAQADYFDETVSGLALRVTKLGTKAWTLHYSAAGGRKRLTLGRYPALSLAGARTAALEAKAAVANGGHPTIAAGGTLGAVWAEFYRREAAGLRSIDQRRRVIERHILPTLGDRPIAEVRRSEIVGLLDGIEDGSGPVAAHVALAYLSRLFNWHASRTDEFRSPIVRGMARINAKERARDRVLGDEELRRLWPAAPGFIRFLLLTAVRRGEAAGMQWSELSGSLWTIPAGRMKGKAEHVVPLSAAAIACMGEAAAAYDPPSSTAEGQGPALLNLRSLAVNGRLAGPFVFGGHRPLGGFSRLKAQLDEAVPLAPWRLHDLRRTARSLLSRAGVSADIAERCLAHAIGGVRGVYDRHAYLEEKRQAFEALAAEIGRIVEIRGMGHG
jgi:integrase